MAGQTANYLHTTHRTAAWFNKVFETGELELAAPFQRNPVWTDAQKAYLIDTMLLGLPIPELYMQDVGDETGGERHIVVDGQQRIRAVLDFLRGNYRLEGLDVAKRWRDLKFEDLSAEEKKVFFGCKFVVRVLPDVGEEAIRKIFSRLNRNVVALNEQELRNATYWGPFIKTVQSMADNDEFWAESGLFSANDHRRMIDHEFISELVVAFLHGPQNKKDRLDYFYQIYEERFEDQERVQRAFRKCTDELSSLLPFPKAGRWKKKSDFYTLFLILAPCSSEFPLSADKRREVSGKIVDFGQSVDRVLALEPEAWADQDKYVVKYARNVARAASDKASRSARAEALWSRVLPLN